ncbi:MAG: hypothetical protein DMD82_14545 [Candidatus Rokuibacteriota bacterium]|nr:MAG: hypothetical protein DMD82_14545 [Candidatus Rokubacteria bacterium]
MDPARLGVARRSRARAHRARAELSGHSGPRLADRARRRRVSPGRVPDREQRRGGSQSHRPVVVFARREYRHRARPAGSLGMLGPALLVSLLLAGALPVLSAPAPARAAPTAPAPSREMRAAMALLILVVTLRSWTQLGFTTFVPFYYVDHLGADPRIVGPLLFVFLGAGALGTIIAGPLADRFGARPFMVWACLLAVPLAIGFVLAHGALAFVMLGAVGFTLISTFSVSVVLGQAYMPRNLGMASGMIVGFAIGAGGLGVTLLGWVADHWGLPVTLWITAVLPLLGFVAALFLPEPKGR